MTHLHEKLHDLVPEPAVPPCVPHLHAAQHVYVEINGFLQVCHRHSDVLQATRVGVRQQQCQLHDHSDDAHLDGIEFEVSTQSAVRSGRGVQTIVDTWLNALACGLADAYPSARMAAKSEAVNRGDSTCQEP